MILYGPEEAPEAKELGQKSPESSTRVEGAPLLPRGQPGTLLAQLFYSMAFFWSKNKFREVSRQLDSVWYSFSVKFKNKEKQKVALGSRLIG